MTFREILDEINKLNTDEELKDFVKQRLDYLEKESKTRELSNMIMNGDKVQYGTNIEGYINSDSPIETSKMADPFYIDDLNLYFDFVKQVKGKDMSNLLSIFYEFNSYTKELFGFKGKQSNREMIYLTEREDNISIADFYHNKSALCSERSASVHNIAEFLGLKSYLIFGKLEVNGIEEPHAYVIFQAKDGTLILFDPTNPVALNNEGNVAFVPAYSIIGKQNIEDIEEIDFDYKTLSSIHKISVDDGEMPRKYRTYKYELNKQK